VAQELQTPLHKAVLGGHSRVVRLLLQEGADHRICDGVSASATG